MCLRGEIAIYLNLSGVKKEKILGFLIIEVPLRQIDGKKKEKKTN